jgi:RNA polymerase sigma-70 factor, ECF subfamily
MALAPDLAANETLALPVSSSDMAADAGSAVPAPSPRDPSDAQLIRESCAGNAASFEALVRRYYRLAFAVALAHSRTRPDAEDVCHDAFVQAAERLEECRHPDRFAGWLSAIVRNRARNMAAHARVRRALPLEHATAPSADDPQHDAEVGDLRARLLGALAALSPIRREVVLLHDLDGRTHDEIASVIGTSSGMSRQHLFKARKALKRALREYDTGEHFDE